MLQLTGETRKAIINRVGINFISTLYHEKNYFNVFDRHGYILPKRN